MNRIVYVFIRALHVHETLIGTNSCWCRAIDDKKKSESIRGKGRLQDPRHRCNCLLRSVPLAPLGRAGSEMGSKILFWGIMLET